MQWSSRSYTRTMDFPGGMRGNKLHGPRSVTPARTHSEHIAFKHIELTAHSQGSQAGRTQKT